LDVWNAEVTKQSRAPVLPACDLGDRLNCYWNKTAAF
jgi:hypothetical protein